jgi:hypothetical protein
MKKILFILLAALLISTAVYAATAVVYNAKESKSYTGLITMATTTTSVDTGQGAGTAYYLSVPMSNFSCDEIVSGVTPTTQTIILQGTLDGGTTWSTLSTSTSTATTRVDSTGKLASGIRINQSILTAATGTKTTTYKCIGQQ